MVSRRNFFTISTLMFVILLLCMFTNNLKDRWNENEANPYVIGTAEDYPSQAGIFLPEHTGEDGKTSEGAPGAEGAGDKKTSGERNPVACIGDRRGALSAAVGQWALYSKRGASVYDSLSGYQEASDGFLEMLVIDPDYVDWHQKEERDFLKKCVDRGTNLVFSGLPEVSVIRRYRDVRELLGIRRVKASWTTAAGIHLYGGFLLGGEVIYQAEEKEEKKYQDMELAFPWYSLSSGTKVYMRGIPEDKQTKKEDYPVLIWRKSFGSAYVFAVNGGYMEGMAGIGLLSAMSAQLKPYTIYPVVNAQNIVLADYPGMADENRETLQEYYARPMKLLCQELLWSNITGALHDYEFGLTCMMAPQYDYSDEALPDPELFQYYLKTFREYSAEPGLSGASVSDTPVEEKLSEDEAFIEKMVPGYQVSSFYAGDMKEEDVEEALGHQLLSSVRTVVRNYEGDDAELFRYLTEHVTEQRGTGDGLTYTYQNDFRIRCVETALGYLNLSCDMGRVVYPQDEQDSWDERYKGFIRNVNVFGQIYEGFSGASATESDARIRNFLALNYTDARDGNRIHLKKKGTEDTVWFVLRTYGDEVKDVEGGAFEELEEGAFLIKAEKNDVEILLEPADKRFYY